MKIPNRELSFMRKMGVARVATADAECVPHVVPVCPLLEGSRVYFASETSAKKVKNINANPQITIVFDEYHDSWRGLKKTALISPMPPESRKGLRVVTAKLKGHAVTTDSAKLASETNPS